MAIQLPNNKISRTLPEQVGFNSAKIEEIIKWINDSNFIDKVLNLSDPSGILTEAQYAIADLSPSYIVYGGKVFIKSLEDSDNIDFFKAGTDMSGSDSMIASVERVRVVKATKAYQYAVVQLFESYSKAQIDALLAAKADLSGANFTGDITAKTLKQNEANWKMEFNDFPTIGAATPTLIFGRIQQLNQELHIVLIGKLENETGSNISGYLTGVLYVELPENIAAKIYDVSGKNVVDSTSNSRISGTFAFVSKSAGIDLGSVQNDCYLMIYNDTYANRMSMRFVRSSALTIDVGESMYFEARLSLDLL